MLDNARYVDHIRNHAGTDTGWPVRAAV